MTPILYINPNILIYMNNLQALVFIITGAFLISAVILVWFDIDDRRKKHYRK